MNIMNNQSPTFRMNIKGLEHRYFNNVPPELKQELIDKANAAVNKDFTVEFLPMKDNWVFLRKTTPEKSSIVEYFPAGYTPMDIVKTFLKAYIPERRVMAKSLVSETNRNVAERYYNKHAV